MRLLTVCNRGYWDRKVPRTRFHAIEALSQLCAVHNTGHGFADWDSSLTVRENVGRFDFRPDWILVYKPDQYDWRGNQIPVVQTFNDCWDRPARLNDLRCCNTRVAIMHHENEVAEWRGRCPAVKFVNIPYGVNTDVFRDHGGGKAVDVLLAGAVHRTIYPLRYRFARLIRSGAFAPFHAIHRKHCGYRLDNPDAEAESYAKLLSLSRICLADTSKYQYAAEKYHEIPACRSVLCGNLPDERQDQFGRFMLAVDPGWSDKRIVKTITTALGEPDRLQTLADAGHDYVHGNFTMERYAERFLEALG